MAKRRVIQRLTPDEVAEKKSIAKELRSTLRQCITEELKKPYTAKIGGIRQAMRKCLKKVSKKRKELQ